MTRRAAKLNDHVLLTVRSSPFLNKLKSELLFQAVRLPNVIDDFNREALLLRLIFPCQLSLS
ncbi:hypothetical protein HmCmsJML010_03812 [Escherichia coli]|nr:hypothetical protein HMPREF0864_02884 [Enterobacteriaceae bacterium 9_2_54FAA]CNK83089.1 Uncharacterised protein [Yersinia frederiksenii]VVY71827.1 Uncharacterised protein [Escherichia coli]EPC06678.1 hypothetical protein HMPREF0864_02879 [Enterobacteriaceae bacterium 9_2_54FAA]VVY73060.1 Uncharacterised protein [Escherichia coli]